MRGGEKKNRHADSSDKQLHRGLFGRQLEMSSGLLPGQKIEYSREGEENGQRENTGETTTGTTPGFYFILMLGLLMEHVWSDGRK